MNIESAIKTKLINELNMLSIEKITEIKDFVEFLQYKSNLSYKNNINLKGVWKGKGFEKLQNLDSEINNIRKDISNDILNREL